MKRFTLLLILFVLLPIQNYAQNCLAPILDVGDTGIILGETSNNVRAEPSTTGSIVGGIEGGGRFSVLELGGCDNGIRWINVEAENGFAGWTAESVSDEAFVRRVVQLDTPFTTLTGVDVAVNLDGTKLVAGDSLYDADDLSVSPVKLPFSGIGVFSPVNANLLFLHISDSQFALIDIEGMNTLWELTMKPPAGVGGGISMWVAHFTDDGQYIIFSATEPESSWTVLNIETLETAWFDRSYYGEVVSLIPNSTSFVRYITSIFAPENPPYMGVDNFVSQTASELNASGMRVAQFKQMLHMPDGLLLTQDSEGIFDLWNADLTFNRSLDLPETDVLDWGIGGKYLVIAQPSPTNTDEYILNILSANSRQLLVQVPIQLDGEQNERIRLVFHPDDSLGLKVGSMFRWIPFNQIVNGDIREITVPSA